MKQLTENNLKEIVNKQFEFAGHNVKAEEVFCGCGEDNCDKCNKGGVEWYRFYKITEEKEEEFRQWLIDYLRTTCKVTKTIAEKEAGWIILSYGLMTLREEDKTY